MVFEKPFFRLYFFIAVLRGNKNSSWSLDLTYLYFLFVKFTSQIIFFTLTAHISLGFRRTNASTRRCTFAGCETPKDRLRILEGFERFRALKINKIFFPKRALVCAHHRHENSWNLDMEERNFSRKQIEDLIELSFANLDSTGLPGKLNTTILVLPILKKIIQNISRKVEDENITF